MDPQPDVIRQQIDQTRCSLTEKLETLEAEVKGTVQSARDTVENAREAVSETITNVKQTVKQTFDLSYQVDHHPWAMLGLSLVSGLVVGALVGSRTNSDRRMVRRMSEASEEPRLRSESSLADGRSRMAYEEPARPGFMDKLSGQLGNELEKVKDLAITTLVGVVSDVARRSIPALGSAVEEMMVRAASESGAPPQQYGEERREPSAESAYQAPPAY